MKKFILVMFIGMVLTIDLYGVVESLKIDDIKEINHIEETTETVYVE